MSPYRGSLGPYVKIFRTLIQGRPPWNEFWLLKMTVRYNGR
jgi:hypothetical protein